MRTRAKRKQIRVTFPDGTSFCYSNVTTTFIAVLNKIGTERFPEIKLELGHLPMISKEIYPKYKEWMKPICDGWYLNAQSDTNQKYIQLRAISDALNLNLSIEIGENLEIQKNPNKTSSPRVKEKILVRFSDDEYIANDNAIDTYLQCLWKMGIDLIFRKGLEWSGKPLITYSKISNQQIQVDSNRWAVIPPTTKDKAKVLHVLALQLKLNITISLV